MDWESGFGAVGNGIVQEVEDEFGANKVMALAASSLVQPLDRPWSEKKSGAEQSGTAPPPGPLPQNRLAQTFNVANSIKLQRGRGLTHSLRARSELLGKLICKEHAC